MQLKHNIYQDSGHFYRKHSRQQWNKDYHAKPNGDGLVITLGVRVWSVGNERLTSDSSNVEEIDRNNLRRITDKLSFRVQCYLLWVWQARL